MLWQAMRGFEEATMLLKNIGKHFEELKDKQAAKIFYAKTEKTTSRAQIIHDSIFQQEQYSEDIRFNKENRKS